MSDLYKPPKNDPKNHLEKAENDSISCPRCHIAFKVSWGKYLKYPLRRFTCDNCGVRFKVKRSLMHYSVGVLAAIPIMLLPAIMIRHYTDYETGRLWLIPGFLIYLMVGKRLDDNLLGDMRTEELR